MNQTSSPPASRDFYKRASRQRLHLLTKEANPMVPCCALYTRQLFHPGSLSGLCTSPCITATGLTTWHASPYPTSQHACFEQAIAKDYQLKPGRPPHMRTYMHTYSIKYTHMCTHSVSSQDYLPPCPLLAGQGITARVDKLGRPSTTVLTKCQNFRSTGALQCMPSLAGSRHRKSNHWRPDHEQ